MKISLIRVIITITLAVFTAAAIETKAQTDLSSESEIIIVGTVVKTEPIGYLIEFPVGHQEVIPLTVSVKKTSGGDYRARVFCLPAIAKRCRNLKPGSFIVLSGFLGANIFIIREEVETHPLVMLVEVVYKPRR